ncbi:MAG: non-ribosomal peptide synthetase [Terriglobales bacterium]
MSPQIAQNAKGLNDVSTRPLDTCSSVGVMPGAERAPAPVSFAQEQIWVHAQLVPETPIYNEPITIRRNGVLDVQVLEHALTEIVRRHEAWRTVFRAVDGEPVQIVQPASPVRLRIADLRGLPAGARESEGRRLAVEDALKPFDLSRGPLFRTLLVHFSDTEHRLFLTLHHIIFDGYSIYRVLLPELARLYKAYSQGKPADLSELPTQYPEFARWERTWLPQGERLASQRAYWRKQLDGHPSVLQLPTDRPRPPAQSFRGAIQPLSFSKELRDALKLLSQREGATLFMGMIAAFASLLSRYSACEDVSIGTVSSGRKRSELEGLLGYFLNPVVLRNDLSGDPTFRELLRRTREVALDALSNDDVPFTQVVNEVHPDRSLSFNPLFQALLTLEPPMSESQDGWTIALTQSEVDTGLSKVDLCLELDDRASGLVGRFKYSSDLFEPATIKRMAGHLTTLLEGVVANPDSRISRLPMLTENERQQLCVQWNDTGARLPARAWVQELFSGQAETTPETVAVVDGDSQLTYGELQTRGDRLAALLQAKGVGPEKLVGLYLEPSWEMPVAILAVLKAGGACVPLDPSYPARRHSHVLQETGMKVLLTQKRLRGQIPPNGVEVVFVDDAPIYAEAATPVRHELAADNLALVIYTSGSTGKPKGVQITHGNLLHSTGARPIYYGPDAGRFLLLSSFAFDSSLAGIFSTLCYGGTLVLTSGSVLSNLTQLASFAEQHKVSHLLCVPSLYSLLLEQAKAGQLASLRVAIVAGEACPVELVERHYRKLPHAVLYNEYGPTEATVWSTVYRCVAGKAEKSIPIGRPIPNSRVYVLDPHMNLLPVGVPGELHIAGGGVARGYLKRPEETRERFVSDIFSEAPGTRMYKTGDLVRYLPDGNLEMLGRLDHQVKIRGFRIEPEEIEAVISEYSGVRQAVVVTRQSEIGQPSLFAFLVPVSFSDFDADGLRRSLATKLPGAMIPASFVVLERLPLMPNGKVDRAALSVPTQPASEGPSMQPNGELEAALAEIWSEVLGKHGFGMTENFFDLGGHSLLVAKLLLRVEQQFEKRLSLANVFQAPTIRQLAEMLDGHGVPNHHPAVVPVQAHGSRPVLYWVRGGSFLHPLAKRLGANQPILGLHLPAADASKLPPPYKFEDISAALVRQLQDVQPKGPYFLAGLCVNGVIAYEMARQLTQQGQQIAMLALFDAQNPAYYENFSHQSRAELLLRRTGHHFRNFRRQKLTEYLHERITGIHRRASVRYWRMRHGLGLSVDYKHLQDLDTIVHPASFVYRPEAYPGEVVFFQSTDWPHGQYWDFYASWDGLIGGGVQVFKISGGHESMFHEENVDLLARKLEACLSQAVKGQAPAVEQVA